MHRRVVSSLVLASRGRAVFNRHTGIVSAGDFHPCVELCRGRLGVALGHSHRERLGDALGHGQELEVLRRLAGTVQFWLGFGTVPIYHVCPVVWMSLL